MQKGFVFILILALIIGIFAISNSSVVPIDFVFAKVQISQAIVIFICVLLGAIIATIFGGIRQISLSKEIKHLKVENKALQDEVDVLKVRMKVKEEHDKDLNTNDLDRIQEDYISNINIDAGEKNDFYKK